MFASSLTARRHGYVGVLLEDHGGHAQPGQAREEIAPLPLRPLQRQQHPGDALLLTQRRDDLIANFLAGCRPNRIANDRITKIASRSTKLHQGGNRK